MNEAWWRLLVAPTGGDLTFQRPKLLSFILFWNNVIVSFSHFLHIFSDLALDFSGSHDTGQTWRDKLFNSFKWSRILNARTNSRLEESCKFTGCLVLSKWTSPLCTQSSNSGDKFSSVTSLQSIKSSTNLRSLKFYCRSLESHFCAVWLS